MGPPRVESGDTFDQAAVTTLPEPASLATHRAGMAFRAAEVSVATS